MKYPTSQTGFRYVNEAVGAFVLVLVGLALFALVQSGRVQQWFDPGAPLIVVLPQSGLSGLTDGSEVNVLGTTAGVVESIDIESDGRIIARVRIRRQFTAFIRSDSRATDPPQARGCRRCLSRYQSRER